MVLVSAIVPTRNRCSLLREALDSICALQREEFDIEVIVVDDGSTDGTAELVTSYPAVYLRTEGIGASAARNVGMGAAKGEFIAFLDDDDVWLPTNIAPQLRAFREHPEYGAVFARVQLTDSNRVPYGEEVPPAPKTSGWIFDDLLTYWPQLGCVVVRTAVAREVGAFDPSLISEEDWDWLLRIARKYPIGRIQDIAVLFRQRGDSDDELSWRRLPDTLKVFRRHTRAMPLVQRLRLQRLIWAHRGWYASGFVSSARYYARHGDRARAARCVGYAMYASPMHTLKLLSSTHRE